MTTATPAQQAAKSTQNRADFWNGRQAAAKSNKDLAAVLVDRARAIATKVSGGDVADPIWWSLAAHLQTWCEDQDRTA